jgi:hypothetical protein
MTADVQRLAMYNLALGIDVGTSGVRAAAVDETGLRVAFAISFREWTPRLISRNALLRRFYELASRFVSMPGARMGKI